MKIHINGHIFSHQDFLGEIFIYDTFNNPVAITTQHKRISLKSGILFSDGKKIDLKKHLGKLEYSLSAYGSSTTIRDIVKENFSWTS